MILAKLICLWCNYTDRSHRLDKNCNKEQFLLVTSTISYVWFSIKLTSLWCNYTNWKKSHIILTKNLAKDQLDKYGREKKK